MTPEQYCYQKTAPAGSPFYFSVTRLSAAQRDTVVALAALYQELNDIVYECHEAALAQIKFAWWRNELSQLLTSKPDHPVLMVLRQHLEKFRIVPQRLIDMLDGIEQNLNLLPFQTFEDVTLHIIHTAGLLEVLIAHVQAQTESISPEIIYALTLVITLSRHIQDFHQDARRGLVYLAEDERQQFGVSSAMLQIKPLPPALKKLLAFQYEKIERAFAKALIEMQARDKTEYSSLLIRAEVARFCMQKIVAGNFENLSKWASISPIRAWWITIKARVFLAER